MLDTQEDWQLIEAIFDALDRPDHIISTVDILAFLKSNPSLMKLNAHINQPPFLKWDGSD